MKKNTFYFSHDYNSRNDEKIKSLIFKYGLRGYGIFWAIIEDLYNNTNELQTNYERIAFELREDIIIVKSIIQDFELFVINDNYFGSISVQKRLDERAEKSKKAKESVKLRWQKHQENKEIDTNVLLPNNDSNTIKESKGKEIKIKETILFNIEERKLKFATTLQPYLLTYGKSFLNDFYKYWTEPNKSNTKFKMELEKTWSLERRFETWAKNEKNFNKKINDTRKPTIDNAIDYLNRGSIPEFIKE
jgi:hypothetical protein